MQSSQIIKLNTNPIMEQKNKGKYSILKKKTDH